MFSIKGSLLLFSETSQCVKDLWSWITDNKWQQGVWTVYTLNMLEVTKLKWRFSLIYLARWEQYHLTLCGTKSQMLSSRWSAVRFIKNKDIIRPTACLGTKQICRAHVSSALADKFRPLPSHLFWIWFGHSQAFIWSLVQISLLRLVVGFGPVSSLVQSTKLQNLDQTVKLGSADQI